VITEGVLLSQYAWVLRDKLRHADWGLTLWRPLVAALVMAAIVFALRDEVFLPLNLLIGAVTYLAGVVLLGAVGRPELDLLSGMRRRAEQTPG
jgi:hypothetical protein